MNITDLPTGGVGNFSNKILAFVKNIIAILNKEDKIGDNLSENSSENSNDSDSNESESSSTMNTDNIAGEDQETQGNNQDTTYTTTRVYKDRPSKSRKYFSNRKEAEKDSVEQSNQKNVESVIIDDYDK